MSAHLRYTNASARSELLQPIRFAKADRISQEYTKGWHATMWLELREIDLAQYTILRVSGGTIGGKELDSDISRKRALRGPPT